MGVAVRIILLSYCRLYLVACSSPSVILPFVGGVDPIHPPSVYQSWGFLTGYPHCPSHAW